MANNDTPSQDATPRRSRWRWLRKPVVLLIMVLLLAASVLLAIHLILRSDLPRQIVIDTVEAQTGLRVEIDQLHSHWDGSTEIQGMRIGLPLAGDDLLVVPSMRVEHARPWLLPFNLGLKRIVIDAPVVTVRKDAADMWNVDEVAALLLTGSSEGATGPLTGLPEVDIRAARIDIVDEPHNSVSLRDVSLQGQPTGGAGWTFRLNLDAAGHRTISGQVVTGGRYSHELQFALKEPLKIVEPIFGVKLPASSIRGQWRGSMADDTLAGTLTLDECSVADATVSGEMGLTVSSGNVVASPAGFVLRHAALPGGEAVVTSGDISLVGSVLRASDVNVSTADGELHLASLFDIATRQGQATVQLREITYLGFSVTARIDSTLTQPVHGDFELVTHLTTTGRFGTFDWTSTGDITVAGSDVSDVEWSATLASSKFSNAASSVDIHEATARGRLVWPVLTMTSATVGTFVTIQTTGSVNFATQAWSLQLQSPDIPLGNPYDEQAPPQMHALSLRADGTGPAFRLTDGKLEGPRMQLDFSGGYSDNGMQPLQLKVQGRAQPIRLATPWGSEVHTSESSVDLAVNGTFNPMLMAISGELAAEQVRYDGHAIGPVRIPVEGSLIPSGALRLISKDIELLGGTWQLLVAADLAASDARITLSAEGIDVSDIDALLPESQALQGTAAIRDLTLHIASGSVRDAEVAGRLHVAGLSARGLALGTLDGDVVLSDREFKLQNIALQQGDGEITGSVVTKLASSLPTQVELTLQRWPLTWPGVDATAAVDGSVAAVVEANELRSVSIAVDTDLTVEGNTAGELHIEAVYGDQRIRLAKLTGQVLEGTIEGTAEVVLDDPLRSTGRIAWESIDLRNAIAVVPQLHLLREYGELAGSVSGNVTMGPSADRRAKGAAEVRLNVDPEDASMRGIAINAATATVFIHPGRVVVDAATVKLDEGAINFWGRATKRGDDMDIFLNANLDALDVAPLLAAVSTDAKPMPGKLSGTMTLHLPPLGMDYADGSADLTIIDSDLARLGPLTALYNAMNLNIFSASQPQGQGRMVARIESGDLYLSEVRYVNRGAHARATGVVRNLSKGRESDVNILAIGTFQPLPRLLFLEDVDNAIRAVQQNLSAVRVQGTLAEPKTTQLSADNLKSLLRSVLVSESAETSSAPQ